MGTQRLLPVNALMFKRPAKKEALKRALDFIEGLNASRMVKVSRANASSSLGLRGAELEILEAIVEKTLLEEGSGLPGWNQAKHAGPKLGLVLRGDLLVKLATGAGPNKDAGSQSVGTVAYAVKNLGQSASAGLSTEGGGAQDTERDSDEEEDEDQVLGFAGPAGKAEAEERFRSSGSECCIVDSA